MSWVFESFFPHGDEQGKMPVAVAAALEEVCSVKMKDTLGDLDGVVEGSMERMAGFLMFAQELKVLVGHVATLFLDDLVNGRVRGIVLGVGLHELVFELGSSALAVFGFAPLEYLCKHAVDILWYWVFTKNVAVDGPHVDTVDKR